MCVCVAGTDTCIPAQMAHVPCSIVPGPTGLEDTSECYVRVPWKLSQPRIPGLLISGPDSNTSNPCKKADLRLWERRDDFDPEVGEPCLAGSSATPAVSDWSFGRAAFILGGNTFRKFGIHLLVLDSVSSYLRSALHFHHQQQCHVQQAENDAQPQNPAAQKTNIRVTIQVPEDITNDPRVVECFIFFAYTGLLVDIHGRSLSSLKVEDMRSPSLRFDVMELYMFADFLQVGRRPLLSLHSVFPVLAVLFFVHCLDVRFVCVCRRQRTLRSCSCPTWSIPSPCLGHALRLSVSRLRST